MNNNIRKSLIPILYIYRILLVFGLVGIGSVQATEIYISSIIHPTTMPAVRDDQFILVDFWATWCGPCIQAMDHIGQLQQAGGEKLLVIGLSNEPAEVVARFFTKREPKTCIAVDADNRTFQQFGITSLPNAALIAPDGEIIWQGKPTHLTAKELQQLLSRKFTPAKVSDKIMIIPEKKSIGVLENPTKSITIGKGFTLSYEPLSIEAGNAHFVKDGKTNFTGKTTEIISTILEVPVSRIHLNIPDSSGSATFDTIINNENRMEFLKTFLASQSLVYLPVTHIGELMELTTTDSTLLWSNEVYEFSEDGSAMMLYSEDNLQADNYSLTALATLLTDILQTDFVYKGKDTKVYDWNLDISNLDTLTKQLLHEYGVTLNKTEGKITNYIFNR